MSETEFFDQYKCLPVKNFIDAQTISVISRYLENKIRRGEWKEVAYADDPTTLFSYYADPLLEVILQESTTAVEGIVRKSLAPTYSCARIYQPGEFLKPHIDRPSCEVSVTINVASKGGISPVYTRYEQTDTKEHILNPGDAVVYMGCDVLHWRQPIEKNQLHVQFMLHYVDKHGPNADYAKDKRPAYGMPISSRSK